MLAHKINSPLLKKLGIKASNFRLQFENNKYVLVKKGLSSQETRKYLFDLLENALNDEEKPPKDRTVFLKEELGLTLDNSVQNIAILIPAIITEIYREQLINQELDLLTDQEQVQQQIDQAYELLHRSKPKEADDLDPLKIKLQNYYYKDLNYYARELETIHLKISKARTVLKEEQLNNGEVKEAKERLKLFKMDLKKITKILDKKIDEFNNSLKKGKNVSVPTAKTVEILNRYGALNLWRKIKSKISSWLKREGKKQERRRSKYYKAILKIEIKFSLELRISILETVLMRSDNVSKRLHALIELQDIFKSSETSNQDKYLAAKTIVKLEKLIKEGKIKPLSELKNTSKCNEFIRDFDENRQMRLMEDNIKKLEREIGRVDKKIKNAETQLLKDKEYAPHKGAQQIHSNVVDSSSSVQLKQKPKKGL